MSALKLIKYQGQSKLSDLVSAHLKKRWNKYFNNTSCYYLKLSDKAQARPQTIWKAAWLFGLLVFTLFS